MNKKVFGLLSLSLLLTGVVTSCSSDTDSSSNSLSEFKIKTYLPVTEALTSKSILSSNFSDTDSNFDNSQIWFQLAGNKLSVSNNSKWSLGFWNGTENRVILNYSVKTQAVEIKGHSNITNVILNGQADLNNAIDNKIDGGIMGFGDLSTFDFHSEKQFVIGDPGSNGKIYLVKQPSIQIHPDVNDPDAPSSTVTTENFLIYVKTTSTGYSLTYQALAKNQFGEWEKLNSEKVVNNISKSNNYQYSFASFEESTPVIIQPTNQDWELALSAVLKKNYMSDGNAYGFVTKGFVLNNNKDISIYRVQSTASDAGAPGSYDPNFNWQNDPALDPTNSIDAQFTAFNYSNIEDSKFSKDTQEEIGQYWRTLSMGQYKIFVDRFYVIKLKNGDVYKLKFVNLSNSSSNSVNDGIKFQYQKIAKQS